MDDKRKERIAKIDFTRHKMVKVRQATINESFWINKATFDFIKKFEDCDVAWEYLHSSGEELKKVGFDRDPLGYLESKLTEEQRAIYDVWGNTVLEYEAITMEGKRVRKAALFATLNNPSNMRSNLVMAEKEVPYEGSNIREDLPENMLV